MDWGEIFGDILGLMRGEIASFGELVFEVHTDTLIDTFLGKETGAKLGRYGLNSKNFGQWIGMPRVLAFQNYEQRTRARLAEHDLINQQSMIEFLGTDAETITLDILLMRDLGVNPAEVTELLRGYLNDGYADFFILGGEIVGDSQWLINDLTEKKTVVDNYGKTTVARLEVEFRSYSEPLAS